MSKKNIRKRNRGEQKHQDNKNQQTKEAFYVNHSIGAVLIVVFTIIAFLPSLKNDFTNWDDRFYIQENPVIKDISGDMLKNVFFGEHKYHMGNYHPLTMLSLAVDFQIDGFNPTVFHAVNLILHILNALLCFWLVFSLFKNMRIAFFAALLWTVHPLHVESVAWIAERKDVLHALFYFSALIAYLFYIDRKQIKLYALAFVFFVLALLSKGQAVSLALVLPLLDYFRERNLRNIIIWIEKLPFAVLSMVFGLIAIKAQDYSNYIATDVYYSTFQRMFFAAYGFVMYMFKTVVPFSLSAIYPYPEIVNGQIPAYFYLFIFPFLAIVLGGFKIFINNRNYSRTVIFGLLFFFVTIAFLLQLIPVGNAIMADRYAYIPSLGVFVVLAFFVDHLLKNHQQKILPIYLGFAAYLLFLGVYTFNQTKIWENDIALFTNVLDKYPNALVALNNRGNAQILAKDYKGAIADFSRAIDLKPDYAKAYSNRGHAYKQEGEHEKAVVDFSKSMQLQGERTDLLYSRATSYGTLKRFSDAIADYSKIIEMEPQNSQALFNRGTDYLKLTKFDLAINDFTKVIGLMPDFAQAYSGRANCLFKMNQYQKAMADYNKAIELDPSHLKAYYNRGMTYANLSEYHKAIQDFGATIKLNPNYALAYYFRAMSWLKLEDSAKACEDLQKANELGFKAAQKALGEYCGR